jgi:hypothetical protein
MSLMTSIRRFTRPHLRTVPSRAGTLQMSSGLPPAGQARDCALPRRRGGCSGTRQTFFTRRRTARLQFSHRTWS